jgi:hypothetical protein
MLESKRTWLISFSIRAKSGWLAAAYLDDGPAVGEADCRLLFEQFPILLGRQLQPYAAAATNR